MLTLFLPILEWICEFICVWCYSCRVTRCGVVVLFLSCVVLFFLCVCVCDLFLFYRLHPNGDSRVLLPLVQPNGKRPDGREQHIYIKNLLVNETVTSGLS